MNRQQLELVVIQAVDTLRSGGHVEDDLVEIKQAWPLPAKARQLAAAANRARGDHLIYIIGLDEKGVAHALDSTDPANWWAQMQARFDDGVAPDLLSHVVVTLDTGEVVEALSFATDRAPYVVKSADGGAQQFEVPIRSATGTGSAGRAALLRMMAPQMAMPTLTLLQADVRLAVIRREGVHTGLSVSVDVRVFLQPQSTSSVLLPEHEVVAGLSSGGAHIPLTYRGSPSAFGVFTKGDSPKPPDFAPYVRSDGIVISGPGTVSFQLSGGAAIEDWDALREIQEWDLNLAFGVAGTNRQLAARVQLLPGVVNEHQERAGMSLWQFSYPRKAYTPEPSKVD